MTAAAALTAGLAALTVAAALAWRWTTRRTGRHHPDRHTRRRLRRTGRAWPPNE